MATARKFFSANVALSAATPTSMASLMQNSILHWWLQSDLISPSLDAGTGDNASIIPDGTVYVGNNNQVRNANATPLYKGVTVTAGVNYSLQDFGKRGNIDPNTIWFYSVGGCNLDLTFQGV